MWGNIGCCLSVQGSSTERSADLSPLSIALIDLEGVLLVLDEAGLSIAAAQLSQVIELVRAEIIPTE